MITYKDMTFCPFHEDCTKGLSPTQEVDDE